MDGIIFSKYSKVIKIINAVSLIFVTIIDCVFIYKRYTINYANVFPEGRSSGIEYSVFYSALSIVLAVFAIYLFICVFLNNSSKVNKVVSIVYFVFVILIIIISVVTLRVPKTDEYRLNEYDNQASEYFFSYDFDNNESSQERYYHKTVTIGKTYWKGGCAYKDFSGDSYQDLEESAAFVSFYYLNDKSGKRIEEFKNHKALTDIFDTEDYEHYKGQDYDVYEYKDSYEFISVTDEKVYYISTSKNQYTPYNKDSFTDMAMNFFEKLEREWQLEISSD